MKLKRIPLGLWLFPKDNPLKQITRDEEIWANKLSKKRKKEFQHSRGYTRQALSSVFNVEPLEIPLHAPPGLPPSLPEAYGHVTISHCEDALIVGWSLRKIGIDIERKDRSISEEKLIQRIFTRDEKNKLLKTGMNQEQVRKIVLSHWTIKEAAIKLQKGSLFKDINKWQYINHSLIHSTSLKRVEVNSFIYDSWLIAVAYEKKLNKINNIICIE